MARKIQQTATIDFDSGEVTEDQLNSRRNAQARLYEITNPYVGSKRSIMLEIAQALDESGVQWNSVFDLFSGSGVVSLFMKLIGKEVVSNDILTSSYYNALSFVENQHVTLTADEIAYLCENNNPGKVPFVLNNYAGKRFTEAEAAFLDSYRANVESLVTRKGGREGAILKAVCIVMIEHYVINHCFVGGRLNSGQILAKLEHRIKHSRSGNDPNADTMQFNLKAPPQFFTSAGRHLALNLDAVEALQTIDRSVDLLYLDPPYGGEQSDYAFMFGFCEEYVYSKSLSEMDHLNKAKKFTKAKDYEEHFREVLSHTGCAKALAVSYNNSSFADLETIKGILRDYRNKVVVEDISHRYKFRSKENMKGTEYLLIAS
jgi:adenine-specific DNA-methyltransferase